MPVTWQAIGYLLFAGVGITLLFLSLASYARVVPVTGVIVPDVGVATIVPTRFGVVGDVHVRDGERVGTGDTLVSIRVEEDAAAGQSASARIAAALGRQAAGLTAQGEASTAQTAAQQAQITAQREGIAGEITQLQSQLALQQQLVASARDDLERVRLVAQRGFISGRDIRLREETLLARQQGVAQLSQTLSSRRAALVEADRNHAQLAVQARLQSAALAASSAEVEQAAAGAQGARNYALRAPVAGTITALLARRGQPTNSQSALMTIVPDGARLRAELAIPTAAVGFVKRGQRVRLAIDAFPYQRFGTVEGNVEAVATSPVNQQGPNGQPLSLYPVIVNIGRTNVTAYGNDEPLVSGMTLTARIVTERQSLLQWLFEPLFAVRRR